MDRSIDVMWAQITLNAIMVTLNGNQTIKPIKDFHTRQLYHKQTAVKFDCRDKEPVRNLLRNNNIELKIAKFYVSTQKVICLHTKKQLSSNPSKLI